MPEQMDTVLQEDISKVKKQYAEAQELLEKINALSIRYDAAFKAFDTRNIDIEKVSNEIRDRFNSIDGLRNDSNNIFLQIKSNLDKTQNAIEQMNEGLQKFENTKGKVEGKNGEIEQLVSTSQNLKNDIENLKVDAQKRLEEVSKQFILAQDKILQIQKTYEDFLVVQSRILDKDNGLQAILDQSNDLKKKSTDFFSEINDFHVRAQKFLLEINSNRDKSNELNKDMMKSLEVINENKIRVEEVTNLITDTGFANAFNSREKLLRKSAGIWMGIFIFSIIGLALMLYFLFKDIFIELKAVPEISLLLFRFALTSPFLFLIGMSVKQYSYERGLNERYAFKATIASVVRNHTDFLLQVSREKNEKESGFIRSTFENLYFEPYDKKVDKKEDQNKNEESKNLDENKQSLVKEIITVSKSLKEVLPSDEVLSKVVDLFIKVK